VPPPVSVALAAVSGSGEHLCLVACYWPGVTGQKLAEAAVRLRTSVRVCGTEEP